MSNANLFCDCNHPATYFCLCSNPVHYFCSNHKDSHQVKNPNLPHDLLPIEADHIVKSLGLEAFRQRRNRVDDTKEAFEHRVRQASEERRRVQSRFDDFLDAVAKRKVEMLDRIDQFLIEADGQYQQFLSNMTEMKYSSEFQPATELDEIAINRKPLERLSLLRLTMDMDDQDMNKLVFDTKCAFNRGLFAISSAVPSVPVLIRSNLYRLSLVPDRHPAVQPINGIECDFTLAQCCQLESNKLFACGGESDPRQAAIIDLVTAKGRRLGEMNSRRESDSGVIYVSPVVYVFGGAYKTSTLKTCELYDTTHNRWKQMNSMNVERKAFCPSHWNGKIYLIGGYTRRAECYSIDSGQFTQLECTVDGKGPSLSFPLSNKLLVFSGKKMYKSRFEDFSLAEMRDLYDATIEPVSIPPVLFNEDIYFACHSSDGQQASLYRYSNETSMFEQFTAGVI